MHIYHFLAFYFRAPYPNPWFAASFQWPVGFPGHDGKNYGLKTGNSFMVTVSSNNGIIIISESDPSLTHYTI